MNNNRPNRVSRHVALAEQLTEEIASGKYPIGTRFPNEQQLQKRFGVGRHTIREALKIMTEKGLLDRRRKTGTVVISLRPVSHYIHSMRDLRSLFDFAQSTKLEIQHMGYAWTSEISSGEYSEFPDRRWLRIAGLRRQRKSGAPLCWAEIGVPERFAIDRDTIAGSTRAIYETLLDQYELKLDYVEQTVSAVKLPDRFSKLFGTEPGCAALLVKRRYVAQTNVTFEISHNLYPGENYVIQSIFRQRT